MISVAINGFGRIGRCTLKAMLDDGDFRIVGINDLSDLDDLAYLLKYDSVHGWYPRRVETEARALLVDDIRIPFYSERDPAKLPWGDRGAEVVLECTGAFRTREAAARHLDAGAGRVAISAPAKDPDGTFVLGVNDADFDPARHRVVSMASCTTNSLAPVAQVLHAEFGIDRLMITTVHAYTSSQSLTDTPMRKRRRGRAGAVSIVPTTTGAARATGLVLPELEGRMDGRAMRVPVPDGSATDIVALLEKPTSVDEIHQALHKAASQPPLKGILRVSHEALVSRDIIGDPHSSIVDADSTQVLGGTLVKLLAWYDNEWGYSSRLKDFAKRIARG